MYSPTACRTAGHTLDTTFSRRPDLIKQRPELCSRTAPKLSVVQHFNGKDRRNFASTRNLCENGAKTRFLPSFIVYLINNDFLGDSSFGNMITQQAIPPDLMERINGRARRAQESAARQVDGKQQPKKMFLPGFDIGAMPNHLNRSSFIAPIARGRRKIHRQATMVSRTDCVWEYTGEELDEADGDIIMALIFFAYPHPLGDFVKLNRAELLRKIDRGTGKRDYDWLHRRIKALTEATMFLEVRKPDGTIKYGLGRTEHMHVVDSFIYDEVEKVYIYKLDPRWEKMFSNQEYARLNWDKRMQIGRGQDMAKTLQRLIATSKDEKQGYTLEWLKEKMGYTSPMRKFRAALTAACDELIRVEIISDACIKVNTKGEMQLTLRLPRRAKV